MKRRDLLKTGIASGFLIGVGSSPATATRTETADLRNDIREPYDDAEIVRSLVDENASELLNKAYGDGRIPSDDVGEITDDQRISPGAKGAGPQSGLNSWKVAAIRKETELTPHVMVSRLIDGVDYTIYIYPDLDTTHLIVAESTGNYLYTTSSCSGSVCNENIDCQDQDEPCAADCSTPCCADAWDYAHEVEYYWEEVDGMQMCSCKVIVDHYCPDPNVYHKCHWDCGHCEWDCIWCDC